MTEPSMPSRQIARRDWFLGRVHIIRRGSLYSGQYGAIAWGRTLDIWFGKTLWTFRWVR